MSNSEPATTLRQAGGFAYKSKNYVNPLKKPAFSLKNIYIVLRKYFFHDLDVNYRTNIQNYNDTVKLSL